MWSPSWKFFVPVLTLVLACGGAAAKRLEDPTALVIPNLPTLSRSSGYIFSGTVTKVERIAARSRKSVAVMRITFQVESAIRGVSRGQKLVIREWAGLWQSGERYRPGERVMLFLYPPSKLGLTSPVGGAMGRFRISPAGRIVVPRGHNPPRSPLLSGTSRPGRIDLLSLRDLERAIRREPAETP
jgi:hypothetical protein